MKRLLATLSATLILCCLASCSADKYMQPGQMLLKRNQLNISMADSSHVPPEVADALADAQHYIYQKPNKRILWVPVWLKLYCATNPTDSSRWSNFWRRTGESPVIYDRNVALRSAEQLAKLMKTKGCFGTTVTTDTIQNGPRSVNATYNVVATARRKIYDVSFVSRQPDIQQLLQQWKEDSYLKAGDYYDQQLMTKEQSRIATNLKSQGYYYAGTEMVRFLVDTTYDSRLLDIIVSVRPTASHSQDTAGNPVLRKYRIDNIYIYPNITTAIDNGHRHFDTLIYPYATRRGTTDYNFIYDKRITPSPKTISHSMFIFNGQTYRPRIASSTSAALLGLHNFKYVDISFDESPNSTDTNCLLDARIRLLNSTRHRLSLSLELTNSSNMGKSGSNIITSGNLGLGATLGYQNSNLLGGAEMLNVEGSLLLDLPKDVFRMQEYDFYSAFASFENSLNASLDLPEFLMPIANEITWQRSKPHTLIELSANYIYRELAIPDISASATSDITLERFRIGSSFGYTWDHSANIKHKLLPFNLSYSHLISGNEYYYFLSELTNDQQFLYQAFDYILLNTHYEYTLSTQKIGSRQNFNYLRFSVETAGNLLNGINSLASRNRDDDNIFDIFYYQYFRFESEFKRYIYAGDKSTFVFRALAGFGIPYGHSGIIPYEKMFVGGGPTTMRGWALRHLGYGQYPTYDNNYAMGTGEIQLVANLEHRYPLIGIFEGALFADIGNVWQCGDWGIGDMFEFNPREIAKGIAFDAGLGLRANISVITLRLDFALPLRDPGYPDGQQWLGTHWGWNKIVTNFGINYPF